MDHTEKQFHSEGTPAVTTTDGKSKEARKAKPSFDSFLDQWRNNLTNGKGNFGRLRALLKTGFLGDVKSEQVTQLYESLIQNGLATERLAAALASQRRVGKMNGLSRSLLDRIRFRFRQAIEYESDNFTGANGSQAVERFVEANAPGRRDSSENEQSRTGQQERTEESKAEISADSWLRQFFVCLCAESEQKVFLSGVIAVGKWWLSGNSAAFLKDHDDVNLIKSFSIALSGGGISRQRLELLFTGIIPLERQFAALRNSELELIRRVRSQDTEIEIARREQLNLENRVASEQEGKLAAQAAAGQLQQALKEANERYELLDQHWRAVSDQNLQKQSGSFRERIGHELQEALLSLERPTPNVSMALLRLKRINEIVKDPGSREE